MKTKNKTTSYIIYSIAAATLVLTAQISPASSATWLLSPQDSAWENANNWTLGGPPNGPSDVATFGQSSQTSVGISTSEEVNSIEFTSAAASFTLSIPPYGVIGGALTISGTGVINNSSVLQSLEAGDSGQIVFNNASTAASGQMQIVNHPGPNYVPAGVTIFNDTSSAAGASIVNASGGFDHYAGQTIFNGASSAGHASITNHGTPETHGSGATTTFNGTSTAANAFIENWGGSSSEGTGAGGTGFNDTSTAGHATIINYGKPSQPDPGGGTGFSGSSTADSAILIANGTGDGGAIVFSDTSTGGTARVEVFDAGYLDISHRQPGVTIGSIEGSGNVYLGANRLLQLAQGTSIPLSPV